MKKLLLQLVMNNTSCIRRDYARVLIGAVVACWLIAAGTAQAQYSENFDYYANGSQVIGQGGWQGWDADSTVSGIVTNAFSSSAPNSVRIYGTALTSGNYCDTVHKFSGYTSGQWIFSTKMYIPSTSVTGTSYFILLDIYNDGGPYNWAIESHFDLAAGTLVENQGTSSTIPIIRDQWVELRYVIDLTANTVSSYYNNTLFSTHAWQSGGVNELQAIDLYSDVSSPVFYDDISIKRARVVTTTAGTGPGSLTAAISALSDGDTIAFNIPGAGPHYIQVPPDGFPLITENNVTIDGYSQAGSSPNTASIHEANNAVLKIVLTATNGNALSMQTAGETSWGAPIPRFGYGDSEMAILGFFHATNATIKGLVFQSNPLGATTQWPVTPGDEGTIKAICFAANSEENGGDRCQNWRVSGCWFGIDPVTKQEVYCEDPLYGLGTVVASPGICIASYRTRNAASPDNTMYNYPGTIGVAAGSANPRADFNVFVTGYGYDSEGLNYRISGNFFGVLPDGVTAKDMGVLSPVQQSDGYIEIGRNDSNVIIGTDGDGVNDDQEGNVFAPLTAGGTCINLYSDPRTNVVVAGNYFGLDINGSPFAGANLNPLVDDLGNQSTFRFGSDFNGVSDAWEANSVTNSRLFVHSIPSVVTNLSWVSMRGNSLQGSTSAFFSRPPLGDGQLSADGYEVYAGFIDISGGNGSLDIIPMIGAGTTTTTLTGTCGKPLGLNIGLCGVTCDPILAHATRPNFSQNMNTLTAL